MIVVLQRVREASVEVDGRVAGRIGAGICILVGVEKGDLEEDADRLARKCAELRIFPDADGRMNRSVLEANGEALAISQFTLAGSVEKGRRPSFDRAEEPGRAERLFDRFAAGLRAAGVPVETGVFRARMDVRILNDGPVTFILRSEPKPGD